MPVPDGGKGVSEYYAAAPGQDGGSRAGREGTGDEGASGSAGDGDSSRPGAAGGDEGARSHGGQGASSPASSPASGSLGPAELAAALGVLAGQAVRERPPGDADLERLIGEAIAGARRGAPPAASFAASSSDSDGGNVDPRPPASGAPQTPFVDMLRGMGYLHPGRDRGQAGTAAGPPEEEQAAGWLTRRGSAAVADRILRDILREMGLHGFGPHETGQRGAGSSALQDQTRRPEPGEPVDAGRIDAVRTVLNAAARAAAAKRRRPSGPGGPGAALPGRAGSAGPFPLDIAPGDIEEAEPAREAGAAIVYCIDLSSTMKYRLGGPAGPSRIEAAKRALWALHTLARRRFPADSVSVVGFASLAARVRPEGIPRLRTFEAGDENLHYTNYQAALRLASLVLDREAGGRNRRIVLITDGQPSACLVESGAQRDAVLSAKPYANLYVPGRGAAARMGRERGMDFAGPGAAARPGLGSGGSGLVYLCYRHKRVDPFIDERTVHEAGRCARRGARIDTIVISDEDELVEYAASLERRLGGIAYHVSGPGMERVVVRDYLAGARRYR